MASTDQPPPANTSATHSTLDEDVGCPACGYNLRGLGSDKVTCPECGTLSDVVELLKRRWDQPWYKAPGYTRLCLPAACLLLSFVALLIMQSIDLAQSQSTRWLPLMVATLLSLTVWVLLMIWPYRSMGGLVGVGFALLAHVAIAGYLLAIPFTIGGAFVLFIGTVNLLGGDSGEPSIPDVVMSILSLCGGIGLFILSRWFERLIAGYCIRMYLRRPTTS